MFTLPLISSSRSFRTSHQRLAIPCTELYLRSRMTASEAITTLLSRTTFVTQQLATQLKLKGKEVSYSVSTLGHSSEVSSKTESINITSVDANQVLKADTVLVVGSIPVRYPTNYVYINLYPHLADLPMPRVGNDVQVDVLIGMDNAYALMPLEVRCSSSDRRQPYATRTLFGWSLNGPVDKLMSAGIVPLC